MQDLYLRNLTALLQSVSMEHKREFLLPPTPGCKPQQPYLSQHGLENVVSESLGEDLSSFAKREALRLSLIHN